MYPNHLFGHWRQYFEDPEFQEPALLYNACLKTDCHHDSSSPKSTSMALLDGRTCHESLDVAF